MHALLEIIVDALVSLFVWWPNKERSTVGESPMDRSARNFYLSCIIVLILAGAAFTIWMLFGK